jgi:hypothetical protein
VNPHDDQHDDVFCGLQPPQFGLRTLLAVVSLLCVALATFVAAGPLLGSGLTLVLLVILAHVAAVAIGTRLWGRPGPNGRGRSHRPSRRG